jgi:hypothetical protein
MWSPSTWSQLVKMNSFPPKRTTRRRTKEMGRKAPPPSAKRRMDQAQSALLRWRATANITIPSESEDQKSQLKRSACQSRPGSAPAARKRPTTPMTTSTARTAFTTPETEPSVRNGIASGSAES